MDKPNRAQQQMEEIRNQMVLMVTRQTSYDYETAEEKLKEKNEIKCFIVYKIFSQ